MSCIKPGVKYALVNERAGTCISVSPKDNKSIVGYEYLGGPNQKWIFEPLPEKNFHIKSEGGRYLSFQGAPHDGKPLVADPPFHAWYPEDEQGVEFGIRLSPKDIWDFNVDLENGSSAPGTKVQLWDRSPGNPNQVWKLKEVR